LTNFFMWQACHHKRPKIERFDIAA